DKEGYKKYICKILGIETKQAKDGDASFQKLTLEELLENQRNRKLFKDEQNWFKEIFFDRLFKPMNQNYRYRGLRSLNALIEEENLPYVILSKKETKGDNRMKMYWVVIKVDDLNE